MRIIYLFLIFGLVLSCGKKGGSSSSKSGVNQVFVHGDPMKIIKGTKQNKTSFLTVNNLSQFDAFMSEGVTLFAQSAVVTEDERNQTDVEEGNEPEEQDLTRKEHFVFTFRKLSTGNYLYSSQKDAIGFEFANRSGALNLVGMRIGKQKFALEAQHYSVSADKSKISFLASSTSEETGKFIVGLSLNRISRGNFIRRTDPDYLYLAGPGVLTPWAVSANREIKVDVCPSVLEQISFSQVQRAFRVWNINRRLSIVPVAATECAPYTDVNQHAVYFVDSYRTEVSKTSSNPGATHTMIDYAKGEIYDADIFLFGEEMKKLKLSQNPQVLDWILTHEFGHFLGLHHKFDGTESLMSYEFTSEMSNYDYMAIWELYGQPI